MSETNKIKLIGRVDCRSLEIELHNLSANIYRHRVGVVSELGR